VASMGSPTIYDAVFPKIVNELMDLAGIEHSIDNPEYARMFSQNARFAGVMDISGQANLLQLRRRLRITIGTTVKKLRAHGACGDVYAITAHSDACLHVRTGIILQTLSGLSCKARASPDASTDERT